MSSLILARGIGSDLHGIFFIIFSLPHSGCFEYVARNKLNKGGELARVENLSGKRSLDQTTRP